MSTNATDRPWLKSYDAQVPASIDYPIQALYGLLDKAAHDHPNRTAIIFKNKKTTYKKLHRQVEIMAANLRAQGAMPGDRVCIMLPNLPQTIIAFWAVLKAGCIAVMTNPLYMEKELTHQVSDSGAEYMIMLDLLWPKIKDIKDKLPIKKYFVTRISDGLGFPLSALYNLKVKREGPPPVPWGDEDIIPFKSLLKGKKRVSEPVSDPKEDVALLQYTGGTTGISKGVMLSHYNLVVNAYQCQAILHAIGKGHETMLGLLPYFHVYGLTVNLLFATCVASTLIPFPRYVPRDVLVAINKLKPTIFPGAPAIYTSLLQQKDINQYDLSSIRYCVSGSAPIPVETIKNFKDRTNAEIIEGYGLTEASPVTHLNPLGGTRKIGSIGLPFPDTDVRVVDMEVGTVPLPSGKVGEMIIKGPQVMKGYWNRPDETAGTLRNGWLYTGDIATMDEEGYFYIVDRKKDMIIHSGYNVYPREIDEVLYEHPKVQEAVAVGVPHKARGEIIKAYIVIKEGEELDKSEVIAFCRKKLASYKVPKMVEFRDELPKTFVGKVLRRTLRAEEEKKIAENVKRETSN